MSSKILLTTSRSPTPRVRTFCNELARVIPGALRTNRGKLSMEGIAEKALEYDANRVVIIDRRHGGPGRIGFFQVSASGLVSVSPVLYVVGIRLQREFRHTRFKSTCSEAIIVSCEDDKEIIKVANSLSSFFNIPAFLVNEKPCKYPMEMRISYDAAYRIQVTFIDTLRNVEVGPRITLSQVIWETNK